MRIAWFIHRYHPCIGGAETYSRAMIRRFVAEGHRVDVFTSDAHELAYYVDPGRRRVEAPGESEVDGARVRRFAVKHLPMQRYLGRLLGGVPHWPTRCRFASYMPILPGIDRVRGDYDAVFGVGFPFTVFSFAAYQTARAAGAPLILTPFLHLATPGDPVNRCYTRPHQKELLARADLIVVPTELEARMIEGWGIPRPRLLRLPMAADREAVTGGDGPRFRARHGLTAGRKVVGQLGTLDPNKGTIDLIRALARLNDGRPHDDPIALILAGAPTPEFESSLAGLGLAGAPWLKRLGPIAASEVPDFYAALDVFAMPSRTDSFGIVFLEAWANGKPVVAASAGGVVEVVHHGRDGLLVPFGDVGRLASAIGDLIDDPAEADRLGAAGRASVEDGGTWDDRFDALNRRLRALAESRSNARGPHFGPRGRPTRIRPSNPSESAAGKT